MIRHTAYRNLRDQGYVTLWPLAQFRGVDAALFQEAALLIVELNKQGWRLAPRQEEQAD